MLMMVFIGTQVVRALMHDGLSVLEKGGARSKNYITGLFYKFSRNVTL